MSRRVNEFKSKTRSQNSGSKNVKKDVLNSARALLKGREMVFNAFESGVFLKPEELKQSKKGTGLKIFTPKQILQRLPIPCPQMRSCRLFILCTNRKKLPKKYITR